MQNKIDLSYTGYLLKTDESFYQLFNPKHFNQQLCTIAFEVDKEKGISNLNLNGASLLDAFKHQISTQPDSHKSPNFKKITSNRSSNQTIKFSELNELEKQCLLVCLYNTFSEHHFTESFSLGKLNFPSLFSNPVDQLKLLESIKSFAQGNDINTENDFFIDHQELIKVANDYNYEMKSFWLRATVISFIVFTLFLIIATSTFNPVFLIGCGLTLLSFIISASMFSLYEFKPIYKNCTQSNNPLDPAIYSPGDTLEKDPVPLLLQPVYYSYSLAYQPTLFLPLQPQPILEYTYPHSALPITYVQSVDTSQPCGDPPPYRYNSNENSLI